MPSTVVARHSRQRPRNAPGGRLEAGELGDPRDELPLGNELSIGQVEHFAHGRRAFRGEEDSFDKIFNIDTISALVARTRSR